MRNSLGAWPGVELHGIANLELARDCLVPIVKVRHQFNRQGLRASCWDVDGRLLSTFTADTVRKRGTVWQGGVVHFVVAVGLCDLAGAAYVTTVAS